MFDVSPIRRIPVESLIPPLAALLVFGLACTFGWVYFDDPAYYTANPLLGEAPLLTRLLSAWTVAPESNWMPLTWSVAIIADFFFEGSARAIHIISIFTHAVSAWLIWYIVRHLGANSWLAVACACVWAVHPLRTESVAWASSLKDVLSGCFALGMLALLADDRRDWRNDWPAFLLFVGSLLSKQVMIAFPAALLLWDFRKTEMNLWTLALARAKWWAAGLGATLIALMVNHHGIKLRETAGLESAGDGVFRGLAAFGHQFQQLWIPGNFSPEYLIESATLTKAVLGALVLISALVAVVALLRKRGGISAWCFVAAVGIFFPLAGWTRSPMEFTADRLSYLPHFFAVAAIGLAMKNFRFTQWVLILGAVAASVITLVQLPSWKNGDALNQSMLQVRPGHPTALENRGAARAGSGDLAGATEDFLAVTRSHPRRVSAWANAARALAIKGDLQRASLVLDEAIAIHPHRSELIDLKQTIDQSSSSP